MIVSVSKIDQERDEIRICDECGAEAPWSEYITDYNEKGLK